jgi:hypothetical protein
VGGGGAGVFGQSVRRRHNFSLGKYATVFKAEIYALLACVHEIKTKGKSEKQMSICSENQAASKDLRNTISRWLVINMVGSHPAVYTLVKFSN